MLRITTDSAADGFVLKLEGRLSGAWVEELDTCFRTAMQSLDGRLIRVDLSDVCSVDDSGRQLLTLMYRAGVVFVTRGCVMRELVREISESTNEASPEAGDVLLGAEGV